jgi:hypothetical protein
VFGDAKDADVAGGFGVDNSDATSRRRHVIWGGTAPMARSPI